MLRQALRYYDWKAKVGGHRIALKGQEYAAVARLPLLAPLALWLSGPWCLCPSGLLPPPRVPYGFAREEAAPRGQKAHRG